MHGDQLREDNVPSTEHVLPGDTAMMATSQLVTRLLERGKLYADQ